MALHHSPKIATDGLVCAFDMNNIKKSWLGQPTTNLVNDSMSIYNNVPGDVSASLTTTGDLYQGARVYKLTLTPITATGVGYLSGSSNPGIGVISSGGGGLANRYTGHSIFFKPTFPTLSSPIYTGYSNIPGWQSNTNYDVVGDGWYRAHVIWYDTVTRSDGKFWAINSAAAQLNVPIVCYWAAPFKEDRNDSAFVSQYVYSSRSTTQSVLDLTGNKIFTANSLTYNSNGTFSFNGSTNYASFILPVSTTGPYTIIQWLRPSTALLSGGSGAAQPTGTNRRTPLVGPGPVWNPGIWVTSDYLRVHANTQYVDAAINWTTTTWAMIGMTYDGTNCRAIFNGSFLSAAFTTAYSPTVTSSMHIGSEIPPGTTSNWLGDIGVTQFYNRVLSAAEIQQNFNAFQGRYGI